MVSQQAGSLDLRSVIDKKKILFVRLGQGSIGIANAQLLGSLVLSKLHQVALSRQDVDESQRTKVNIYVDECQYFLTPSITALLSGGRKHGVGLVLATQEFFALWNADKEVASAVLTNPYTRVCFRLGDIDAKKLDSFSHFDAHDLQNLGVGEAIVRMERNEYDFNLKTLPPPTIDPDQARIKRIQITALSRKQYGRKPEEPKPQVRVSPAPQIAPLTEPTLLKAEDSPAPQLTQPTLTTMSAEQLQPRGTETAPPLLGRGGQQHKYLQNIIKRLAEDKGFHVTIEQPVLSGTGSVDVALERAGHKIACEISVASTTDYELRNVQKCLAAGFDHVVVLSSEKKAIARIRKLVASELDTESCKRVLALLPEEFIQFLDQNILTAKTAEKTVHGYKVKLKYKVQPNREQTAQRQAIAGVILQAFKRLKDER